MLRGITAVLLLTLAACPSDWSKRDTLLEGAAITVTIIDWKQSRRYARDCTELNPIIGECGERMGVDAYFLSAILVEGIVSRLLPTHWRPAFQGVWLGAEGATVIGNYVDDLD